MFQFGRTFLVHFYRNADLDVEIYSTKISLVVIIDSASKLFSEELEKGLAVKTKFYRSSVSKLWPLHKDLLGG